MQPCQWKRWIVLKASILLANIQRKKDGLLRGDNIRLSPDPPPSASSLLQFLLLSYPEMSCPTSPSLPLVCPCCCFTGMGNTRDTCCFFAAVTWLPRMMGYILWLAKHTMLSEHTFFYCSGLIGSYPKKILAYITETTESVLIKCLWGKRSYNWGYHFEKDFHPNPN